MAANYLKKQKRTPVRPSIVRLVGSRQLTAGKWQLTVACFATDVSIVRLALFVYIYTRVSLHCFSFLLCLFICAIWLLFTVADKQMLFSVSSSGMCINIYQLVVCCLTTGSFSAFSAFMVCQARSFATKLGLLWWNVRRFITSRCSTFGLLTCCCRNFGQYVCTLNHRSPDWLSNWPVGYERAGISMIVQAKRNATVWVISGIGEVSRRTLWQPVNKVHVYKLVKRTF